MAIRRSRRKQTVSFDQRLRQAATAAREAATQLPAGQERDALMKKARQAETAASINKLLSSPALRRSTSASVEPARLSSSANRSACPEPSVIPPVPAVE
jgi:hypothetical protein